MKAKHVERRVRVGVFESSDQARAAVEALLAEGFSKEHVSVLCSDEIKEAQFREFEHDKPAGTKTPMTATTGAVIGGILGGIVGVLSGGGGGTIVVLGPLAAGTGAAVGTFVGAMSSRGVEREVANYYDQALAKGRILVAAEIENDDRSMLARAERVFERAGAKPVPLPQG